MSALGESPERVARQCFGPFVRAAEQPTPDGRPVSADRSGTRRNSWPASWRRRKGLPPRRRKARCHSTPLGHRRGLRTERRSSPAEVETESAALPPRSRPVAPRGCPRRDEPRHLAPRQDVAGRWPITARFPSAAHMHRQADCRVLGPPAPSEGDLPSSKRRVRPGRHRVLLRKRQARSRPAAAGRTRRAR